MTYLTRSRVGGKAGQVVGGITSRWVPRGERAPQRGEQLRALNATVLAMSERTAAGDGSPYGNATGANASTQHLPSHSRASRSLHEQLDDSTSARGGVPLARGRAGHVPASPPSTRHSLPALVMLADPPSGGFEVMKRTFQLGFSRCHHRWPRPAGLRRAGTVLPEHRHGCRWWWSHPGAHPARVADARLIMDSSSDSSSVPSSRRWNSVSSREAIPVARLRRPLA